MKVAELYQLQHNGSPVKKFNALNKTDANKECRSFETDYKLKKHSCKVVFLYNTDCYGRKV